MPTTRTEALGEVELPTARLAVRDRLILRSLVRAGRPYEGSRFADIGCGYHAHSSRSLIAQARSTVLVDVAIADELERDPRVTALRGPLPEVLDRIPDDSLDVLLCSAVLEHLDEPLATLAHFPRMLAPGGRCLINVPTWRGKRVLEFAAFRLGLSADEMDDHKMYYDPRDLWPLLVEAGFSPSGIRCRRQALGFNTLAVCTTT